MTSTEYKKVVVSWRETLDIAKDERNRSSPLEFLDYFKTLLKPFHDQLVVYANEMSLDKTQSTMTPDGIKSLVQQTRAALRFGLWSVSPIHENDQKSSDGTSLLSDLQRTAVREGNWHQPLSSLLSHNRGENKCRLLSARLLCNLITSNLETASILISSIPISPSEGMITSSILRSMTIQQTEERIVIATANFVDMILSASKSSDRDALAAIVATLYNCIAILSADAHTFVPSVCNNSDFVHRVASDTMLLNTLLRQFVTAKSAILSLRQSSTGSHHRSKIGPCDNEANDSWDAATEWIQLLLAKLAKLGKLPMMYDSVKNQSENKNNPIVNPEQIVLLHSMAAEASSYLMQYNDAKTMENPFGSEGGEDVIRENYLFLSNLATICSLRVLKFLNIKSDDECSDSLSRAGHVTVLEIVGSTLGLDNALTANLRQIVGTKSELIPNSIQCLGVVTDLLAERSVAKRARDVHMSNEEQQFLKNLVIVIGNLCYHCPYNQNLLRNTLLPLDPKKCNNSSSDSIQNKSRNGLHVLLSCTSYATSCFALREWCVIAIRNVLEENTENQAVLAELVAQDPVQLAELETVGIRLELDSKGKVKLSKMDKIVEVEDTEEHGQSLDENEGI